MPRIKNQPCRLAGLFAYVSFMDPQKAHLRQQNFFGGSIGLPLSGQSFFDLLQWLGGFHGHIQLAPALVFPVGRKAGIERQG